jgi:hypothetical protein
MDITSCNGYHGDDSRTNSTEDITVAIDGDGIHGSGVGSGQGGRKEAR